jgi:uncharacterized protein Yka (UPF0111/DUF47 family)
MIFKFEIWVAWLAATVTASITLTAFAYTNFETKDHSKEAQDNLVKRLDRIEEKIDQILLGK